jgi:uncharacterized protein (DUF885 family)
MHTTRREALKGAASFVALSASASPARAASSAEQQAQALIDRIAEMLLSDGPEGATTLGIDKDQRAHLKHKLSDRAAAGLEAIAGRLKAAVADLAKIDRTALSATMAVHVDVAQTAFESALGGFAFPYGDVAVGGWRNTPYAMVQNVGAYIDTPRLLTTDHTIKTPDDAEAYLDRLKAYADQIDGETERLKIAASHGVIAPDFLLDKCLKQLQLTRAGDPATWEIVTSLASRAAGMKGKFEKQAIEICTQRIGPALDRQIAENEAHRAKATSDAGVWKFKDGDGYYAWALSAGTTTKMTPDEVHALGLEQVKELHARMDKILQAEGYKQGTVGARMTAIGHDDKYKFPEGDAGRAEIMTFLNARVADIRARMPQAFNTLVKGDVEVKRLPLSEEPGAPAAYGGPGSIDGTLPGKFWINLRTTDLHRKYTLPDLTYHEAIPGHAWQGEYTFKMPLVRSLLQFNSYSEGWALYAEQLADELGVYNNNPVERLGYLQSLAFRACRLVVDTGLHAKRWTRAQAVEWFATTNGSGIEEVTSEVDRYCSWPGQACGYKVGHSEINRLRDHAKKELGAKYDFKAFNDAVVLGGNVPMLTLGRVIERHIVERKA